jgi:hypothetical protein
MLKKPIRARAVDCIFFPFGQNMFGGNKRLRSDEDMSEQNNTWMHFVVTHNIAPYAVQIKKLVDCTTVGEIVQDLQEECKLTNGCRIIAKKPFNKKRPASQLESSEVEPLFFVPFGWVFDYEGKNTVSITFYFSQQLFRFAFGAQDAVFVKSNSYKL